MGKKSASEKEMKEKNERENKEIEDEQQKWEQRKDTSALVVALVAHCTGIFALLHFCTFALHFCFQLRGIWPGHEEPILWRITPE
jgi:hypothetical protein